MSEEEKEAIEHFKNYPTNWEFVYEVDNKAINTVLNYIDKLEKKNEELKEDNSHQWKERCRLTFKLDKLQKEVEELKKELEIFNGIKKGTTIMFGAKTQYWRRDKIEKYFISKDKIRNKIKELKKLKDDEYIEFGNTETYYALLNQIAILDSLLRGDDIDDKDR